MSTADRLQCEQHFHDAQAHERARAGVLNSLCFSDDDYLDHESWIRPAFDQLGAVRDRRVSAGAEVSAMVVP